jgi:hypothetical protein
MQIHPDIWLDIHRRQHAEAIAAAAASRAAAEARPPGREPRIAVLLTALRLRPAPRC